MNSKSLLRTSLEIDENLLNEAMVLGNLKTKKQAIENALKEFVAKRKQKNLYDLFDSEENLIADDYDYKTIRGGVMQE